jgi:hypothetical protein
MTATNSFPPLEVGLSVLVTYSFDALLTLMTHTLLIPKKAYRQNPLPMKIRFQAPSARLPLSVFSSTVP